MYAVVKTGGKQTRVAQGERVQVEHLGVSVGDDVALTPVLVVDGDPVLSTPDDLAKACVSLRGARETKGPKITGYTYKNNNHSSKRWCHRQGHDVVEITGIANARAQISN